MKRPGYFAAAPAVKLQNTGQNTGGPPPEQGEAWTCKDCQNVNWPLRTSCNRCKAAGPWTCSACGNKNFQGREVCNRRNCGLPRPGSSPNPGCWTLPPGQMGVRVPMKPPPMMRAPMMQAPMAQMGGKGGGNPAGSWQCSGCQNVNWPLRTTCKKCQMPREQADMGVLHSSNGGEHPPGSWKCLGCENVNWPKRTTCKKCELSREHADGGPPPSSMTYAPPQPMSYGGCGNTYGAWSLGPPPAQSTGKHPAGSWVCTGCENVNWPMRTTCKKCELPREQADGGSPTDKPPEGSWTCPSCSNLNWPMRTTCNKKSCGQPRPFE